MGGSKSARRLPTEIVSHDAILGGVPCIAGTRVPAATVLASLADGHTAAEILADYPSLPPDAVEVVRAWAAERVDRPE